MIEFVATTSIAAFIIGIDIVSAIAVIILLSASEIWIETLPSVFWILHLPILVRGCFCPDIEKDIVKLRFDDWLDDVFEFEMEKGIEKDDTSNISDAIEY